MVCHWTPGHTLRRFDSAERPSIKLTTVPTLGFLIL
jgi:hypothetical protein